MWINREDLKKKKSKNCREANHIRLPLKRGEFFTQGGFRNLQITFQYCKPSVSFLLLLKHQEILLLCLIEYHDDGVSLKLNETVSFQICGGDKCISIELTVISLLTQLFSSPS